MLRKAAMLLAGALVAVLIAAGAGADHARAVAVGEPLEVQVRVMARGTNDGTGRVEFGLQQIQADGEWGETKFPKGRYMTPELIAAGRWTDSSPLIVSVTTPLVYDSIAPGDMMATDDSMDRALPWREERSLSTIVVIIVARGTNDGTGRVEFGVQQREVSGYGGIRLGRGRYMTPALIADGGWKRATPVTVAVPLWNGVNQIARGTQVGDWYVRWTNDPEYGFQTVDVLNGNAQRALGYSSRLLLTQRIWLRCIWSPDRDPHAGYELEAMVHWNEYDAWLYRDDPIEEGPHSFQYRIGFTDRVDEADWYFFHLDNDDYDLTDPDEFWEYTALDVSRAPDPKQFVDDLMWGAARGETAVFRSAGRALVFNLAGLTSVVRHLSRCYVPPPVQAGYGR